jgi:23S rRNA-/tRNA-specific pseudouridylate synthase
MPARPPRRRAAVLFEDDALLVLNKPAGTPADPDRDVPLPPAPVAAGVADADGLRAAIGLETEASGVVVYPRLPTAAAALAEQIRAGGFERVFFALASGYVPGAGVVEARIEYHRGARRARIVPVRGQVAVTEYKVSDRVAGHTWLECRTVTAVPHQVRAHLAHAGYPLTVDLAYGGGRGILLSTYKGNYRPNRRGEERPLIARLTLHSLRATFDHPVTGARLTFEAPVPKDLRATLSQLGRLAQRDGG